MKIPNLVKTGIITIHLRMRPGDKILSLMRIMHNAGVDYDYDIVYTGPMKKDDFLEEDVYWEKRCFMNNGRWG